jgi:hypothetical protein
MSTKAFCSRIAAFYMVIAAIATSNRLAERKRHCQDELPWLHINGTPVRVNALELQVDPRPRRVGKFPICTKLIL